MKPEHLFAAADFLGVEPRWLAIGEGPKHPPVGDLPPDLLEAIRAMDVALDAVETNGRPDMGAVARTSSLPEALQKPYVSWVKALVEHYMDLLAGDGDSFESLVRAAYRSRTDYLLTLNRLNTVEKEFYTALKPHMGAAEGAADIIATTWPTE